jgi:adenosylcobinamide-GDP ribazoletransferase
VAEFRDRLDLFARRFALALQHATRVRVGGALAPDPEPDADAIRASGAHLPGAGWVVGIAACLSFALTALALRGTPWNAAVAAVASTMVTVALTGGRHESALFGIAERAQPGSGAGVLTLVLVLAAKLALLAAIASVSEAGIMAALLAGHVVSRVAPLALARGLGGRGEPGALSVAALWCAIPLALMLLADGVAFTLLPVLLAGLACYGMLLWSRRRAHDAGDLAAVQQVCELAFYLGAAIGA